MLEMQEVKAEAAYETPVLLDLEEVVSGCSGTCDTGGSGAQN